MSSDGCSRKHRPDKLQDERKWDESREYEKGIVRKRKRRPAPYLASPVRQKHKPPSRSRMGQSSGQAYCQSRKTVVAQRNGKNWRRARRYRPRQEDGRIHFLRLCGGKSQRTPKSL